MSGRFRNEQSHRGIDAAKIARTVVGEVRAAPAVYLPKPAVGKTHGILGCKRQVAFGKIQRDGNQYLFEKQFSVFIAFREKNSVSVKSHAAIDDTRKFVIKKKA